jgi:methylphosphotriester-DNA--protein-cysteine methyltransferase
VNLRYVILLLLVMPGCLNGAPARPPISTSPRRLEEAQRQLRDTNASILEIALAVGFSSAAHFASQSKRQLGVTPSAFRSAR